MIKAPPLPFYLPDTPPVTPEHLEDQVKLPETPRTPRKPKEPRQSALPDCHGGFALLRFELVSSDRRETPTLKIRVRSRGRSLLKARRRLWNREYESLEFLELEKRERGNAFAAGRKARGEFSADGTDADDEMEGGSGVLSPPHSPDSSLNGESDAGPGRSASDRDKKSKIKTCASCKTKKTPLWRDSEDGTPYCNACGIRYKKYCCIKSGGYAKSVHWLHNTVLWLSPSFLV